MELVALQVLQLLKASERVRNSLLYDSNAEEDDWVDWVKGIRLKNRQPGGKELPLLKQQKLGFLGGAVGLVNETTPAQRNKTNMNTIWHIPHDSGETWWNIVPTNSPEPCHCAYAVWLWPGLSRLYGVSCGSSLANDRRLLCVHKRNAMIHVMIYCFGMLWWWHLNFGVFVLFAGWVFEVLLWMWASLSSPLCEERGPGTNNNSLSGTCWIIYTKGVMCLVVDF